MTDQRPAPDTRCAVWTEFTVGGRPSGRVGCAVYDTEDAAATLAAEASVDDPTLVIVGVQFPDGRTIRADEWQAFQAAIPAARAAAAAEASRRLRRRFEFRLSPFAEPGDAVLPEIQPRFPGSWFGWAGVPATPDTPAWVGVDSRPDPNSLAEPEPDRS